MTRQLVAMLRVGIALDTAIEAVGVARRTVYYWLEQGRADGARLEYREFAERIARANAEGEADLVAKVRDAAEKDWRAAKFLLEHMAPDRFGARPAAAASADPDPAGLPDPQPSGAAAPDW